MRFHFLTLGYHPDTDGGAFRYAAEVAEVLASRGHSVEVISKAPPASARSDVRILPSTEMRNGVRLHRVTGTGGSFLQNWRSVVGEAGGVLDRLQRSAPKSLIASHHAYFEPAVRGRRPTVFFHGPWGLEHRFATAARPRPIWIRIRDSLISSWLHRAEGRALRGADRILVASRYMAERLGAWHPRLTAEVEVVGGGANPGRFHDGLDREALRRKWGLAEEDRLFLSVRRLDPRMGLAVLVEAFAKVSATCSTARLWIAGKGAQREELERLAVSLGLGNRIRFLGFVPEEELPGLYTVADAVLMPSLDLEGFGLVTAEALSCGTPVLASDAGANTEVVGPLSPELIFRSGSVEALAECMSRFVSGASRIPARSACSDFARRTFRWDRAADAFERQATKWEAAP